MAHINSFVYLDQESWLETSPTQPAIRPCCPPGITYVPGFEEAVYLAREHRTEQIVPYQGMMSSGMGCCLICKALHDRNKGGHTHQDLPPAVIHARGEFTPVCCERHFHFVSDDEILSGITSYPSILNGPRTTNSITIVQSTVNLPSYVILNSDQGKHHRASREPRSVTPKIMQRERRRRTRNQHRSINLRQKDRKTVEPRDIKMPDSTGNGSPQPSRLHSPIPFSRAPTLAETSAPVQSVTGRITNLPPQAPSDSPKFHPQEPQGCMQHRHENLDSTRQGGLKCGRAESILSSSTDSTKLGIIPPHKLAVPRNPHKMTNNRPPLTGMRHYTDRKSGKKGWWKFWKN